MTDSCHLFSRDDLTFREGFKKKEEKEGGGGLEIANFSCIGRGEVRTHNGKFHI